MNEKSKNLIGVIFQSVILTMFFLPGMYTNHVWWADESLPIGAGFSQKDWGQISLFTKIEYAAWPVGVLLILAAAAGTVFFILRLIGKGPHISGKLALVFPLVELAILFLYTYVWPHNDGYEHAFHDYYSYYHEFDPSFLFYLAAAAIIAQIVIFCIASLGGKKTGAAENA